MIQKTINHRKKRQMNLTRGKLQRPWNSLPRVVLALWNNQRKFCYVIHCTGTWQFTDRPFLCFLQNCTVWSYLSRFGYSPRWMPISARDEWGEVSDYGVTHSKTFFDCFITLVQHGEANFMERKRLVFIQHWLPIVSRLHHWLSPQCLRCHSNRLSVI